MLRGRFGDTSGAAFIEGRLFIPRLNIQSNISFCVDTGADKTVLLPTDAIKMELDYDALQEDSQPSVGIGGFSYNFVEPAIITFNEPRKAIQAYQIDLLIIEPEVALMELPSLLGRDILNQWRMRYSPTSNRLTFDVITADFTFPL